MSRLPMGKMLLWNIIRHTDAHNKIQEEAEMWKMRDWETQTSNHRHLPADCMRGHMHCDRVPDYSQNLIRSRERSSGHDDRKARYWSRKLYEFEANDPERWGHSGFKELYPEEFESDSDESGGTKKNSHHKTKKSKSNPNSKCSKKSSGKKKKKRKNEKKKRKRAECLSRDSSSDDSSASKSKQRKKRTKVRHKNKKSARNKEDSSSGDGGEEGEKERRGHTHKKRKLDKGSDSGLDSRKRRRKDWKTEDKSSEESSLE
ncbi:hypothetical protein LDENG_00209360 [Lucifuga dentata]|nr:hypothetical protein LDENG_00209360 [Lucifuga dentata]